MEQEEQERSKTNKDADAVERRHGVGWIALYVLSPDAGGIRHGIRHVCRGHQQHDSVSAQKKEEVN